MLSTKRIVAIVILTAVVVVTSYLAWVVVSHRTARKYERGYTQIKVGDSKDLVINLMGEPSRTTDCVHPWFADEKREAEYRSSCKELYIYEVFPVDYTISFDKQGKVINKTSAVSP